MFRRVPLFSVFFCILTFFKYSLLQVDALKSLMDMTSLLCDCVNKKAGQFLREGELLYSVYGYVYKIMYQFCEINLNSNTFLCIISAVFAAIFQKRRL